MHKNRILNAIHRFLLDFLLQYKREVKEKLKQWKEKNEKIKFKKSRKTVRAQIMNIFLKQAYTQPIFTIWSEPFTICMMCIVCYI